MATDLDLLNMPLARGGIAEIFSPTNGWPGIGPRVYVDVNRAYNGVYQTGYDPTTMRQWMRYRAFDDAAWSTWKSFDGSSTPDAPIVTSSYAILGRSAVLINFSLALDSTAVPATTAFTVTGRTVTVVTVGAPAGGVNAVRLDLNSNLTAGTSPTVSYVQPAPPRLKSVDAIDVASFSNFAIVN